MEHGSLRRRDNSSRDCYRLLRADLRYRIGPLAKAFPVTGSGILTGFPFDRARRSCKHKSPILNTELPYLLGPTDPCSTAVHMEPFSTHQSSRFSLEYLLLPPRSAPVAAQPGLTPEASQLTTAPAYSPQTAYSCSFCDGSV